MNWRKLSINWTTHQKCGISILILNLCNMTLRVSILNISYVRFIEPQDSLIMFLCVDDLIFVGNKLNMRMIRLSLLWSHISPTATFSFSSNMRVPPSRLVPVLESIIQGVCVISSRPIRSLSPKPMVLLKSSRLGVACTCSYESSSSCHPYKIHRPTLRATLDTHYSTRVRKHTHIRKVRENTRRYILSFQP